jgi:chromosomal replication initiator protein
MNLQPALPGFDAHRRAAQISVADIQREVAAFFGIPALEMTSARRARKIARPRQVAMFFSRERTPHSLPNIGRMFGHRDHTTVLHAIRTVEGLIATDAAFAAKVAECGARL